MLVYLPSLCFNLEMLVLNINFCINRLDTPVVDLGSSQMGARHKLANILLLFDQGVQISAFKTGFMKMRTIFTFGIR